MHPIAYKFLTRFYGFYLNFLSLFSKKMAAQKAFDLFSKVRKGKILPHQEKYLQQAQDELHTIGEHRVQSYRWKGTKERVLLLHGWESNSFRWRNLIEKLREADFDIITFDAPGHGHSSGSQLHLPLYEEALNHLSKKYDPDYLIGHSMGGFTILYHHYIRKETFIKKIVTIGSPSEFHEVMAHYQQLLRFNDTVLNALDAHVKSKFGMGFRDFSSVKFVQTIDKKGLLLHDKFDLITKYEASERVYAHWKGSTLISTEGLGHSMHQEHVNEQIIDFLKSRE
jgi:pimeloyl-ACP methyl ester carboxylesterase